MFGLFRRKKPPAAPRTFSPPVPAWRPAVEQPLDRIADRCRYYMNDARDFVVCTHGTCVVLPDGLGDAEAEAYARDVLQRILRAHPDMKPTTMDDGHLVIFYSHPAAASIVLRDIADAHWSDIEAQFLSAVATDEVLFAGRGPNQFDDDGKRALFGRCFMFMDAQAPHVARIERKLGPPAAPTVTERSGD